LLSINQGWRLPARDTDIAKANYCPAVLALAGAAAVLAGAIAVLAGAIAAVEAAAGAIAGAAVAAAGGVASGAGVEAESSLLPQALKARTAASEAAQSRVRVIFINISRFQGWKEIFYI
jgi:hypothetical protein